MRIGWKRGRDPGKRGRDPGERCAGPGCFAVLGDNGPVPTYRDQAVVLRTHKLGEADRIITLLCRDHGKVRAVARGVRRTSSKFGARLEPYSHIDVQFATGRSLDVVTQAVSLHQYARPLVGDFGRWTMGQVMVETADRLVAEEKEPALAQYRLLLGALRTLGHGTPDGMRPGSMVLDAYLLRAMAISGYAPSFTACAVCGEPGPHRAFSPASGGSVCVSCRPPGATRPRPETLALLGSLLTGDWKATRGVPDVVLREADELTSAFVTWHLDRGLRSLMHVDWS